MSSSSHHHPSWPPTSEPITPLLVVGRLAELAYSAAEYQLVANTRRHALVQRTDGDRVFYIVSLVDGRERSWYETEDGAWRAWGVFRRRDEEGDDQ